MSRHGRARGEPFHTGSGPAALLALALFAGCTAVAGLDKEYVAEPEEGAQGGTAGVLAGNGGRAGSGSGGTASSTCENTGCPSGEKCCGAPTYADAGLDPNVRQCVEPSPAFGCGATDCDSCPFPPPENSISVCKDGRCGIQCHPGFSEQSGQCVANGSGGAGGTGSGGTGGGAPACDLTQCRGCGFAGPFTCCREDGSGCGCTWAPLYCW
ncbi:MAG TPA: hypothetical protein VI072_10290 [Polyangiaceae bacterium]